MSNVLSMSQVIHYSISWVNFVKAIQILNKLYKRKLISCEDIVEHVGRRGEAGQVPV